MDFNSLMAKMRELDQPAPTAPVVDAPVEECGEPMMGNMPAPMADKPDTPPPSMSINVNAQGLDDIADLMKLLTKVNPDMINQPMPAEMPNIMPPGPSISGIGDLGDLDKGPLKMLPDLDKEPEGEPMGMPGPDSMNGPDGGDDVSKAQGDLDNDGDHDMDDHEIEKKDDNDKPEDDEKKEGFQDATTTPDEQYKNVDYMVNKLAGGMNKSHQQFKHSYKAGDNPMAMPESTDLRASIRAELQKRLAEAKGAK